MRPRAHIPFINDTFHFLECHHTHVTRCSPVAQTDATKAGVINRADVASLLVSVMDDKSTIKKIYSAIDPSQEK